MVKPFSLNITIGGITLPAKCGQMQGHREDRQYLLLVSPASTKAARGIPYTTLFSVCFRCYIQSTIGERNWWTIGSDQQSVTYAMQIYRIIFTGYHYL